MTFNEQLICRRKQKGLSQEQLGDIIGVTRQTVSKWELGETTPEMDKLIQLASLFEVSIDELVGKETEEAGSGSLCMMHNAFHYEYKSRKTFRGVPVVHINLGFGLHKAKGIIAIGNLAEGVISLGILSAGILSMGVLSAGIISFGAFVLGLLLAAGGISVGFISLGGIAVGVLALGGVAVGFYSIGGLAIADKIAMGGYARGTIAIGDKSVGDVLFDIHRTGQGAEIRAAILAKYPNTPEIILKMFAK